MHPDVQKRVISHGQLNFYDEACIAVLVLLAIHTTLSWAGLLGAGSPVTDAFVAYLRMFADWGTPIVLGILGITFGVIGFKTLRKKKTTTERLKESIYVTTIFFSALAVLGNAGFILLIVML